MSKRTLVIVIAILVALGAAAAWFFLRAPKLPEGFASGNGRLEATDYYVAAKRPGRIVEILAKEGDEVKAGQVVARIDPEEIEAEIRETEGKILEARAKIRVAEADKAHAQAQVRVRRADFSYADSALKRSSALVKRGGVSQDEYEVDQARRAASEAEVIGAEAQVAQADSRIAAAKAEVQALEAQADRLRAVLKDLVLVAPIDGRVERRLAELGEVVPAGGRVFSMLDLTDVYMYIFLPTETVGRLKLGSAARIVLDAAPDSAIPATISYISPEAQFTPKTVETAEERFSLTFRVKLQLDPERLRAFGPLVKSGIPGVGFVRTNEALEWPANLVPSGPPPGWATGPAPAAAPAASPAAGAGAAQ